MKNSNSLQDCVILGIDPGTATTGFGLIRYRSGAQEVLEYGCIRPPSRMLLSDRYLIIYEDVKEIIHRYHPDVIAVETQYVSKKNPQSAIKVGMARGVVIVAARKQGIPVFEYAPARAKQAVCHGRASKYQVQMMIRHLLKLQKIPSEDASDALALAICHGNAIVNQGILGKQL